MATILNFWRGASRSDAFADLIRPHMPRLYSLAYRLTGSEIESEDLLQDLVLKLRSSEDNIASLDKPGTWLARVLYRMYVDGYRRAQRSPLNLADSGGDDNQNALADIQREQSQQPERLFERYLQAENLQRALDKLNPEQRDVVVLHDVEGYSLPELEELLSLPLGTLKSRLHRGRRRLRDLLTMEPFGER